MTGRTTVPTATKTKRPSSVTPFIVALAVGSLMAAACGSTPSDEAKAGDTVGRTQSGDDDQTADNVPVVSVDDTTDATDNTDPNQESETVESDTDSPSTTEAPGPTDPDLVPLPDSAAAMVEALNAAEMAIRDADQAVDQRAAWGRRQQALYRHLSNNQDWVPTALAETDPAIREAVSLNWSARESLSSLLNTEKLHDELPAWRVTPPAPAEELIGYYKQAEEEWGIQWEFLAGINLIETRMGRIQGVSTAGAIGPMQFLPTTWAECCQGDPTLPRDAISGAAKYLTIRGGPENMDRAIWGYNNSDYYVNAVTAYANVLMADEQAYYGYHAWQIYFLSTEGLLRIPVGYEQLEPIPAADWLAQNPDALFAE